MDMPKEPGVDRAMAMRRPCRPRFVRISLDDPVTLHRWVREGLIWDFKTYWQLGVDTIESGAVPLAACKDVPPQIMELLTTRCSWRRRTP